MKNNQSKAESGQWPWRILVVLFCVVVWGGLFAFGDYFRQFTAKTSFSRRLASDTVQHDTSSTITRRFVLGGTGGAVLGILLVIRDLRTRKCDDDNA